MLLDTGELNSLEKLYFMQVLKPVGRALESRLSNKKHSKILLHGRFVQKLKQGFFVRIGHVRFASAVIRMSSIFIDSTSFIRSLRLDFIYLIFIYSIFISSTSFIRSLRLGFIYSIFIYSIFIGSTSFIQSLRLDFIYLNFIYSIFIGSTPFIQSLRLDFIYLNFIYSIFIGSTSFIQSPRLFLKIFFYSKSE